MSMKKIVLDLSLRILKENQLKGKYVTYKMENGF